MIIGYILLAVVILLVLWAVAVFNGLVTLRNRVKEAWSDIDVQLKRRYDLIPNLVAAVQGYAAHEKSVFENVTKARNMGVQAQQQGDVAGAARAENMLTGALKSLFAVAEAYPDLKANQNFLDLQMNLTDTENKIQAARRFYNGNTRDFNTKQEVFPSSVVAGMFGFKPATFFELEDAAQREAPKVSF